MKELKKLELTLIEDRKTMKIRVNLIKKDFIKGWLKPVGVVNVGSQK